MTEDASRPGDEAHAAAVAAAQAPVLEADHARIALDDVPAVSDLCLTTRGTRVALGGDVGALIGLLLGAPRQPCPPGARRPMGTARLLAGSLRLCGKDVAEREHFGLAGMAPLDPPLPESSTLLEYLIWGGRLGGLSPARARDGATSALDIVGLGRAGARPLRTLRWPERRVAVLAQALVRNPQVLVCEAPLGGLDPQAAAFVGDALRRATEGRAAVLSVARILPPSPESAIASTATDLCWLGSGRLLMHAEPRGLLAAQRWVELTVAGEVEALRAELRSRGIRLEGGPLHFLAIMPARAHDAAGAERGITPILAAATAAKAPVLRCVPVLG